MVLPTAFCIIQECDNVTLSKFSLYYLSSGCLWEVETKENFKLLALKVVTGAYERWSLARGSTSKCSDLKAGC